MQTFILFAVCLLMAAGVLATPSPKTDSSLWKEEFFQDFSTMTMDDLRKSWAYQPGWSTNNELEYYTTSERNLNITNGYLNFTAIHEIVVTPTGQANYTSANIYTKQSFTYGKFAIRAMVPNGRGLWPALWLLGSNMNEVTWPWCGEIDIFESVGFQPNVAHGTFHNEEYSSLKGNEPTATVRVPTMSTEFHEYSATWTPDEIVIYVDDIELISYKNDRSCQQQTWPYDHGFNLKMNLAVGGNWGGMHGVDDSIFPASMLIESVKVWSYVGPATGKCVAYAYVAQFNVTGPADTWRSNVFSDPTKMRNLYDMFQSEMASALNLTLTSEVTVNNFLLQEGLEVNSHTILVNFSVTGLSPSQAGTTFAKARHGPNFLSQTMQTLLFDDEGATTSVGLWDVGSCDSCFVPFSDSTGASSVPVPVPFRQHMLPKYEGIVGSLPFYLPAVEYDFGGPGVAYRDNNTYNMYDYFNKDGQFKYVDQFRSRPDWVDMDIQPQFDDGGTQYYVGYFVDSEWLHYSGLYVPTADEGRKSNQPPQIQGFTVAAECANKEKAPGVLQLEFRKVPSQIDRSTGTWLDHNGRVIESKSVTLTAEITPMWSVFQETRREKIELEAGAQYLMRATFPTPNYAIRRFKFFATGVVHENSGNAPSKSSGLPTWSIALLVVGGCLALGGIAFVLRTIQKTKRTRLVDEDITDYESISSSQV